MTATLATAIRDLPHAWKGPPVTGRLRVTPEDFLVSERPLVAPAGSGEHVWLLIRKRLENTETLARRLARIAGVHPREVSYAGLKDRNAVTEQWFSVHLPGRPDPDWRPLDSAGVTLLRRERHTRKLRRGALRGNAFRLRVRALRGDAGELERRLQQIAAGGVPNYFGEQRFGRDAANLHSAQRLFAGSAGRLTRHQRGLALSAARAFLFNQVLAERVAQGSWNHALDGEVLQLAGSRSWFIAQAADPELERRLRALDVHPTGPLAGAGHTPAGQACAALEKRVLTAYDNWCAGLARAGLRQERRPLRLVVESLVWTWPQPDCLELGFTLPAGAYATSVMRELVRQEDGR